MSHTDAVQTTRPTRGGRRADGSAAGATRPSLRRLLRGWVLDPLVRGLTGLPLAVAAVPMALIGGAGPVGRAQARLAHRYNGGAGGRARAGRIGEGAQATPTGPANTGRVLAHTLLVLPPATATFALVAMQLFLIYSGHLYPLRPDTIGAIGHPFTPDPILTGAWGGRTLAGAWFVHSTAALGLQLICAILLRGLLRLQNRIAFRLLGGYAGPPPPGRMAG